MTRTVPGRPKKLKLDAIINSNTRTKVFAHIYNVTLPMYDLGLNCLHVDVFKFINNPNISGHKKNGQCNY